MTDKQTKGRRTTKAERLLALARDLYEPHKATKWPYLLRDGEQFKFEGPDRRRLQAGLRAAWRTRYPAEAAPAAPDLNAVADDLRHLAEKAEPDPAGTDDQAAEIISAHGISEVPQDRGLALVTQREDCPLPGGYTIPEPYIVAADGIHLMKDDGTGHARVTWAWLFPVRVYVDPGGDQLVELAWRDGPRWVSRLIRRAVTKSGRKLVTEAGDAGLPVIEAEARQGPDEGTRYQHIDSLFGDDLPLAGHLSSIAGHRRLVEHGHGHLGKVSPSPPSGSQKLLKGRVPHDSLAERAAMKAGSWPTTQLLS